MVHRLVPTRLRSSTSPQPARSPLPPSASLPARSPSACGALVLASLLLGFACSGDDADDEVGMMAVGGAGGEASMEAAGGATMEPAEEPAGLTAPEDFAMNVHPILVESCSPCHAIGEQADPDPDVAFAAVTAASDQGTFMTLMLDRIGPEPPQFGSRARMPLAQCAGAPGTPGCVTEEEYAVIAGWADTWLSDVDM